MIIPEVLKVEIENSSDNLSGLLMAFARLNLNVLSLQSISKFQRKTIWEVTVEINEEQLNCVLKDLSEVPSIKIIGKSDRVFGRHLGGKIEMSSKAPVASHEELRDIYTPGVARVCLAIQKNPELADKYTSISKNIAIVTNGTAILGLGNIGAVAGMPVMEGKAALFHKLAGLSGIPILIESNDVKTIVDTVVNIAPGFGAIQLEDIRSPECFAIERELQERLNIPVLHDDQHGTAVVALAALLSATKHIKKDLKESVIGQVGLGAAGIGIARLLISYGVKNIIGTDLSEEATKYFESFGGKRASSLENLMQEADIVIATTGVKGLIKPNWVKQGQLILALTNPEPEIEPALALAHGAAFAADGKSVNNVLGFPGLFKGVMQAKAKRFTSEMLIASAIAIHEEAGEGLLVPDALDKTVHDKVAMKIVDIVNSAKS